MEEGRRESVEVFIVLVDERGGKEYKKEEGKG
jgi:hypothetical protein